MSFKRFTLISIIVLVALAIASCAPAPTAEPEAEEADVPSVFAAFATAIEEPWDGVIHEALKKAEGEDRITYEYTDDIGYAGDMERVLREVAEEIGLKGNC